MNKKLNVYKFQILDNLQAVGIFYGIVVVIIALMSLKPDVQSGTNHVSGMDGASAIFIFVAGLNCFKSNFKFMQLFNVSRRTFYAMTLLSLLTLAAGMTLVDAALAQLFKLMIDYKSLFEALYNQGLAAQLLWEFAFLSMAVTVGWFVNLLYYRSSKLLKIVISLSPVYLSILSGFIGRTFPAFFNAIAFLLGFAPGISPVLSALGLAISTVIALTLSFLLIRKAPIKA